MNFIKLRYFSGLCNDYRRFIPTFSYITAMLNRMLRKERSSSFETVDDSAMNAFTELEPELSGPLIISLAREYL